MNDERLGTCPREAQIRFSGKHDSQCYEIAVARLESELREAREGKAEAERAVSLARELQKCDRHRIEYLEGQVRALNGALGR